MSKNSTHKAKINTIWMLSREYGTLAGAGGVKDVSKHLAEALAAMGKKVRVVLPCYGFMSPKELGFSLLPIAFDVEMPYVGRQRREAATVWVKEDTVSIYLIDSPRFHEKGGVYTYTAEEEASDPNHKQGSGHYDYFAMNILLQKAALNLMIRLGERPDIIHCHDGHTALLPAMIREKEGFRWLFHDTGCVVTIHNAGRGYHQEVGDLAFAQAITGLPSRIISDNLLEGSFDPFLAASHYAIINTVSENYARELIETYDDELTGWLGHQLSIKGVTLRGITNGIDPKEFDMSDPAALGIDAAIVPGESPSGAQKTKPSGKAKNRKCLITDINNRTLTNKKIRLDGSLSDAPDQPLFTFVGRLTAQKGVDKMIGALKNLLLLDPDFQILILGSGDKAIENALVGLANHPANKGRICLLRGYDPLLANRVYAAGDFFLVPSRYEPCGLTDLIAQLFANIPIVHHIGGLVKVIDGISGFAYQGHTQEMLAATMSRAMKLFREQPEEIAKMQKNAVQMIKEKYTWDIVVKEYLELYDESLKLSLRSYL